MNGAKIVFKSGRVQPITIEIANIIRDNIVNGTKNFQCFSEPDGNVFLIINLLEVEYIYDISYAE